MAFNEGTLRAYLNSKLLIKCGQSITAHSAKYGTVVHPPSMILIDTEPVVDHPDGYRTWYEIHMDELTDVIYRGVVSGDITADADPDAATQIKAYMAGDVVLGPFLEANL